VHEALSRITALLGSASQSYETTEATVTRVSDSATVATAKLKTGE
jgi:hypothetical protein